MNKTFETQDDKIYNEVYNNKIEDKFKEINSLMQNNIELILNVDLNQKFQYLENKY